MKITNCAHNINGFSYNPNKYNFSPVQSSPSDSLELSAVNTNSSISFGQNSSGNIPNKPIKSFDIIAQTSGILFGFSKIFKNKPAVEEVQPFGSPEGVTDFHKLLAQGVKDKFNINIPAQNLKSIMPPEELKQTLTEVTTDNFIAKAKNIRSGKYFIDLDYESNHTRGVKENIFDIMNEAALYADKYYEKTGKPFIFALADRESMESLEHVIRIIGENPEKYQHMKFVPAIKISYAHEAPQSGIQYENCNLLVYGVNPFSAKLSSFLKRTTRKRQEMVINFIKQVCQLYPEFSYSINEFAKQNKIKYQKDFIPNLYWRAREYAEKKGETEMKSKEKVPQAVINEAQQIISEMGRILVKDETDSVEYADSSITSNTGLNSTIKRIFEQYSTHKDKDGNLVSAAENLFNEIISQLDSEEHKPVIAYAAPYYLCRDFDTYDDIQNHKFPKTVQYMQQMKDKSNGMIMAFQSVVPIYNLDNNLPLETIKKFNTYIRENTDLYEVGGSFAQCDKTLLVNS